MAYKTKAEKKAFKAGLWTGMRRGKKRSLKNLSYIPKMYRINKSDPRYIVANRAAKYEILKTGQHSDNIGPRTLDFYYKVKKDKKFYDELMNDFGPDLKKR